MIKILKVLLSFCLFGAVAILLIINTKLHSTPDRSDLLKQLNFLERALDNNADLAMQNHYPEGYVFMNALYGISWCNVLTNNNDPALYEKGHEQIQKAFTKVNSEIGRSNFDDKLTIPFGAFYTGWNNYLLGRKLSIEPPALRDTVDILQFELQCKIIGEVLDKEIYPPSYHGGVWPADVMLCAVSLSLHDKIFEPKYKEVLSTWTKRIQESLDQNGLIPHSIDYANLTVAETARGSSQSLILIFLKEIDPEFAKKQYTIYEDKFIDTKFGLTGVREYPKGESGFGDIDSGPIVLGMGGAATIVAQQTTFLFGNSIVSSKLNGTIESLAFPYQNKSQKFYLFGSLPMVDAFVTWSRSSQLSVSQSFEFYTAFHLYSCLLTGLLILLMWLPWKKSTRLKIP